MNTRTADGALEHLGVFDGVALTRVGGDLGLAQLRHALDGILQVHLLAVGQPVGDSLLQRVRAVDGQLLHARHVGNGVFRGHAGVGDDMGAVLGAILIHDPPQHLAAAVVVEVGIDIRQVDTVGVEETLKQQVVFQRVNLRDAEAVGHHRTGG